ncbi:MAG: hypothetical protein AAFV29_05565 [Myxococcota bacterium]
MILVAIALLSDRLSDGLAASAALATAVFFHELGHFAVSRVLGGTSGLLLQVGGGRAYLKGIEGTGPQVAVLVAGGLAGLVPFTASLYLEYFGAELRNWVTLWTLYQWLPFPPLDGGQIWSITLLRRTKSSLVRWRSLWLSGLLVVVALGVTVPQLIQPLLYFTAMAVLLARSEAGAMRYADAYQAWEEGDHRTVIDRALSAPSYLSDDELTLLAVLGLASARAIDDDEALEALAEILPPHHPERLRVAEQLLRGGRAEGTVLARLAFEAFDGGRVSRKEIDDEQWADLAFHYASAEAAGGRRDTALDLLERAEALGFDHLDRLQADHALAGLEDQPRYRAVVERLQARMN